MSRPQSLVDTGGPEQRWLPLMTVAPYGIMAALVIATVVIKWGDAASLLIDLCLCAVTVLWMLWLFTLHPGWRERGGLMALFFVGLIVLVGFLVVRDPWFGLFTPACYFYAFGILPWPSRLVGVAAVALLSGSAQAAGIATDSAVGLIAVAVVLAANVLCMCVFGWWERETEQRDEQREFALRQVQEANRQLEAMMAENAGLQRQLLTQAREAGVLAERQRMAREIHDTLAQGLIGIVTQLQAAAQVDHEPERWQRHFEAATRMARESLAEARRSVDALRPQPLESAGLAEALVGVAKRWSDLHGVQVEVSTAGTSRAMPPEAELALLRAAQEALANVARHAQAISVSLVLRYQDDGVTLEIRDDGRGFDTTPTTRLSSTQPAGPGGFGLKAMRERIEGLSGTLRVQSQSGAGTTIAASLPHKRAEASA